MNMIAIFMLATIPPLLGPHVVEQKGLQGIDWERRLKIREALIIARLPHAVHLWRNLLLTFKNKNRKMKLRSVRKMCANISNS